MWINDNDELRNLKGLENLVSANRLGIVQHEKLANLKGLEGLQAVFDGLVIENNPALKNLNGLNNLATVGIDESITTQRGLLIKWNTSLVSLGGLENLKTIEGDLYIWGCPIVNMQGMNALENIGRTLYIYFNESLESIEDLEALSSIGDRIRINLNSILTDCAIDYFCDNLEGFPTENISIFGNAFGCRNKEEILNVCDQRGNARVFDANPTLYEGLIEPGGSITDLTAEEIIEQGIARNGIAADGVTEIVLVIQVR